MFDSYVSTSPYETITYSWERHFAWTPVRVKGKLKWLTRVWRKQIPVYGDGKNRPPIYKYGDLFDVIRES